MILRGVSGFCLSISAAACGLARVAAPTPARAVVIVPNYGSITSPGVIGAISAAVSTIDSLYTNTVVIPINFTNVSSGNPLSLENNNGPVYFTSYTNYVAALATDLALNPTNAVLSTALTNLPSGNDASGKGPVAMSYAQAALLSQYNGAIPAPTLSPTNPITVNINSLITTFSDTRPVSSSQFDLTGGLEHELNEVLSGGGGGTTLGAIAQGACTPGSSLGYYCGTFGGLDLYRYTNKGGTVSPSFSTSSAATSYFSIDGGKTPIVNFNQNSAYDFGDFAPPGTGPGELIQNAFNNPGQYESYTNSSPEAEMEQALGWDLSKPCNIECYNTFVGPPKVGKKAIKFTLELAGDVTTQINTAETGIDTLVNPFAYVNQAYFGGSGTSSATVTFDGTNTFITYTGTDPILSSDTYSYGTDPHFGFQGNEAPGSPVAFSPGTKPIDLLNEYWTYDDGSLDQQAALGMACTGGGADYIVMFAEVTTGSGTTGEWNECQGTAVTLTNPLGLDETLSDVGYFLSDSSIPLDDLNYGDFPPPDQPGSQFADLGSLDGLTLGPDGSVSTSLAPEPSSIATISTALVALLGLGRRRRRSAASSGSCR